MNQSEVLGSNRSGKNCEAKDQYSNILFSGNSSQKRFPQGTLPLFEKEIIIKMILTKTVQRIN
tara:strand:- start:165 stop:353 length:189 start_codon:yes stop_codon:yes gene_type:complete